MTFHGGLVLSFDITADIRVLMATVMPCGTRHKFIQLGPRHDGRSCVVHRHVEHLDALSLAAAVLILLQQHARHRGLLMTWVLCSKSCLVLMYMHAVGLHQHPASETLHFTIQPAVPWQADDSVTAERDISHAAFCACGCR